MSGIEIKYCIDNLESAPFTDEWDIEGGLSVTKDSVTLTKRIDDQNDDGFRGDYVFFNLLDWLTSTLELLENKICRCQLIDGGGTFLFEPKKNVTYFKYYIEGIGQLIERENKRYTNHEEGTPFKTDELILEIIRVSELFINTIDPKIKKKCNVILFKQALEEARDAYDQYIILKEQY